MLLPASTYTGASAFAWPAALFLWGPGAWTDLHRHHCVQLVMALTGNIRFRQRQRQRWTTCGAVLVRPDAWHEVDARGTHVMIAFVDAESDLGAALAARTESHVAPIPAGTVAAWRAQLGKPASLTAARVEPWVTPPCSASVDLRRLITESNASCALFQGNWRKRRRCHWMLSPRASGSLRRDSCICSPRQSAFHYDRTYSGCDCSVAPVSSRAACRWRMQRMLPVSRMRHTSPGRSVG